VAATEKYSILGGTGLYAYELQNAKDASSMFLRIASELGLFGILLVLFFLVSHYFIVHKEDLDGLVLKMISAAFLVTILLQLFRQGNFILNGFPFYVYGYYFAWKQFKQRPQGKAEVL
jgi:predicted membrane protein